jgi:hypothetical protein
MRRLSITCMEFNTFAHSFSHSTSHSSSHSRIALELLKDPDGAVKLTRRLSIICLEDGLLHPQLPLVVWTMMALVSAAGGVLTLSVPTPLLVVS